MAAGIAGGAGTLAVAVLAACCLSGCTGPSPAPATPTAAVTAAIVQGRTDYSRNVFSISVTNTGAEAITVDTATYTSPRFTAPAVYDDHPVELPPGDTVSLRTPIPAVDCSGAEEIGSVRLELGPEAEPRVVVVTPDDPNLTVDRLLREGCLSADVDAVAAIRPPEHLRIEGTGASAVAWIDLVVQPTGADGSVTLHDVRSTTLMSPTDGDRWPLDRTVTAASAAETIPLAMRPTRCDPHALADDKVGTILVIDVSTGTGREGRYLLPLPPTAKADAYAFISAVCGL